MRKIFESRTRFINFELQFKNFWKFESPNQNFISNKKGFLDIFKGRYPNKKLFLEFLENSRPPEKNIFRVRNIRTPYSILKFRFFVYFRNKVWNLPLAICCWPSCYFELSDFIKNQETVFAISWTSSNDFL